MTVCLFLLRGIAQFGSVVVLGTTGRRFESCYPDFVGDIDLREVVLCWLLYVQVLTMFLDFSS